MTDPIDCRNDGDTVLLPERDQHPPADIGGRGAEGAVVEQLVDRHIEGDADYGHAMSG